MALLRHGVEVFTHRFPDGELLVNCPASIRPHIKYHPRAFVSSNSTVAESITKLGDVALAVEQSRRFPSFVQIVGHEYELLRTDACSAQHTALAIPRVSACSYVDCQQRSLSPPVVVSLVHLRDALTDISDTSSHPHQCRLRRRTCFR